MSKIKGVEKFKRDLTVLEIVEDILLVIACDSLGGIGPKREDRVRVSAELVGSYTSRVALMEVLSVAAQPISIINTLSVEYEPTGRKILNGIREEAGKIGLDSEKIINGSTEENIETSQTGMGVTVIARVDKDKLKMATSKADDLIIAIGLPLVGEEVVCNEGQIADLFDLQQLLKFKEVHEIIPVGSQGLAYEANILAKMSGLDLIIEENGRIDLNKSAGPATTLLAAIPEFILDEVKNAIKKPIHIIGRLSG